MLKRLLARLAPRRADDVTLIGTPFRAVGRGDDLRAIWRALQAVGITAKVFDLDPGGVLNEVDDPQVRAQLVAKVPHGGIRLFHSNGDEAGPARAKLSRQGLGVFSSGYNIISPAWELPSYPADWAHELDRYDEVWTASAFVDQAIRGAVHVPVLHIPNGCEPRITEELDRAYFGLPDDAYLVLFFFEYFSSTWRKNPGAVIDAFRQAAEARPGASLRLVIKSNHGGFKPQEAAELAEAVAALGDKAVLIERTMSDNEIKNLIAVCDCFMSLHRSEGFGRGPAEAMFLGKSVIATGWSGNMEYMTPEVSFPVSYRLVPVGEGQYIRGENQLWADPDRDEAAAILMRLVDDPDMGRTVGRRAAEHMQRHFSAAALGARYRQRFAEIAALPRRRW